MRACIHFQDLRANPVIGIAAAAAANRAALYYVFVLSATPAKHWAADGRTAAAFSTFSAFPPSADILPAWTAGQNVERLTNNISWSRKLTSDTGLVTES